MTNNTNKSSSIDQLLVIMQQLRDREAGCPWDIEQDFASIAPYTIEEAYEVADAIDRKDMAALKDELGDLLLQVVFHAQMASEIDAFTFSDVADAICAKMVRRHPHVFGAKDIEGAKAETSDAVKTNWEMIKAAERANEASDSSALASIALPLPALLRAQKMQSRAARTGFDWPVIEGAIDKFKEEIEELSAAKSDQDKFEEMGDLLFACVNVARHMDISAEAALKAGTQKFERRFRAMEKIAGRKFIDLNLSEKEQLWQTVKANEHKVN
jgi:nucleoside triphosphate diphosphatase